MWSDAEKAVKFRQIAEYLPQEWSYEEDQWGNPLIAGPDGMAIRPYPECHGRDRVGGDVPSDFRYESGLAAADAEAMSIGLSLHRPARELAREIERRLLPSYGPIYRRLATRAAAHKELQESKETCFLRARALKPAWLPERCLEPRNPETVKLSLDLTLEQLERVFQVLAPIET